MATLVGYTETSGTSYEIAQTINTVLRDQIGATSFALEVPQLSQYLDSADAVILVAESAGAQSWDATASGFIMANTAELADKSLLLVVTDEDGLTPELADVLDSYNAREVIEISDTAQAEEWAVTASHRGVK